MGEGSGNSPSYIQEPRTNRDASKGRAQFDQTHAATAHFVYELPFGKGLRGLPAVFLKGWETNGIVTLKSGLPYNVTGGDLNTGLASYIRPDRIADGRLFDRASRQLWYDPTAFRRVTCNIPGRPDLCHYGNSGYYPLVSPGQRNLDFSAFKNFEIREGTKLQFRSEFFNATNTPFFGGPERPQLRNHHIDCPGRAARGEDPWIAHAHAHHSVCVEVILLSPAAEAGARGQESKQESKHEA